MIEPMHYNKGSKLVRFGFNINIMSFNTYERYGWLTHKLAKIIIINHFILKLYKPNILKYSSI